MTDTCSTCHSLFNNGASIGSLSPINSDAITGKPTIPGGMATASLRSAYDLGDGRYLTAADPVAGHEIGAPTSPDGTVIEGEIGGASATQGGLYCGSCHTPHGDFGKLVNSVYYRSEASNCTGVSATTAPCAGAKTNEIQTLTISDTTITPAKFGSRSVARRHPLRASRSTPLRQRFSRRSRGSATSARQRRPRADPWPTSS